MKYAALQCANETLKFNVKSEHKEARHIND